VLDADYYRRIEAMNYSMAHDDGQGDDLASADVILLGISRTSKTPTSIYLGHRGIAPPISRWSRARRCRKILPAEEAA
jgi:regulator of PEP synthase PpsR (kinase-PPPase family)